MPCVFFRFTLGFRIFQAFFFNFPTNLPNVFAISAGLLSTRAAVKELGFRAEARAVDSPGAESELQLQLSF